MPEFPIYSSGINAPSKSWEVVTPSDSTNLTGTTRGVYVGVGGNVAAVPANGGSAVTFVGASAGSILPIQATRINSTGTTATNLVALY